MIKTGFGGEVIEIVIVATVLVVVIAAVVPTNPPSVIKLAMVRRSLKKALLTVGVIAVKAAVANFGAASTTSSTMGMLMYCASVLKVVLSFEMLRASDVLVPPS